MIDIESISPIIIAGIINVNAYVIISYIIPNVFNPKTLITPISNVLVSIDTISKLCIKNIQSTIKTTIITLSVIPKNKALIFNGYIS